MLATSTIERNPITRLKQMASKLLMNGYPFFMCLVLFGYEANIGPRLEETPKVLSFSRTLKEDPDQYDSYRSNSEA